MKNGKITFDRVDHRNITQKITMQATRSSKNWTKNQRKREENEELRELYPPYCPSSHLEIFHVHYRSTVQSIEELIKKARETRRFVVDTESQYKKLRKGEPKTNGALIQIQMIHSTIYSTVLLIETCYLPDTQSILYQKIKNLCDIIFDSNNEIVTWGPIEQEFTSFHHFNLIHLGNVRKCDLQFYFSNPNQNYDTHPEMERREMTGDVSMTIDTPGDELIVFADEDDWNFDDGGDVRHKEKLNAPLGLQTAVAENFNKFLDKSYTKNEWNCGLDLNLGTWRRQQFSRGKYDEKKEKQERQEMLQYAVHDCASVADLYFRKYPNKGNDYSTPPETPTTTTTTTIPITTAATTFQVPQFERAVIPVEHQASEQNQRSEQNQGKMLTKREIFLDHPELLFQMDEDEFIEFQRPAFEKEKQQAPQPTAQELARKKEKQRAKNEKYKWKKHNRPDFTHRIIRPIYHRYDFRKIRAQLQEDRINHSHQINIDKRRGEVSINFKSEELKQEGKKKVSISYFSRSQYFERWGQ